MTKTLYSTWLETPIGRMLAIADDKALYLLEFDGRKSLDKGLARLRQKANATIVCGRTAVIDSIERELSLYFKGELQVFNTPLINFGTPFQKSVWKELQNIPCGQTLSYSELAAAVGRPTAFRAVAQANGANQHALIVPCHRVINASGELGGYAGGLSKKQWLLDHEKN
jgi:AraC family transcriptional regulator of adaptative response/methylated-DNA-[protein]-cysteine methyltransferase